MSRCAVTMRYSLCWIYCRKSETLFVFSIIPQHRNRTCLWNPSLWKTRTYPTTVIITYLKGDPVENYAEWPGAWRHHTISWSNFVLSLVRYNDVIISAMASQIIGVFIVCSTIDSGADQRKHQSFASLAFVRGIHRWPVNSPHKSQ